jgi:hypothetical protein
MDEKMKIKAILSTTVLPLDGAYSVVTLEKIPEITGIPHYIGHPDTKTIVESLGAIQADSKLFEGLQPGESALSFSIAQGKSNRGADGFSSPHQNISIEDLACRLITRANVCSFCGHEARLFPYWSCSGCGAT